MVCPGLTLTATAVSWADGLSSMVSTSTATRLAMGLGVWSEPQGYAFNVFCSKTSEREETEVLTRKV